MEASWVYHVFLISCVQCIIVIWSAVSIETLSTSEATSAANNSSVFGADVCHVLVNECMSAPCPPPDNLHLLCDVNIGNFTTCAERALIIEKCLDRFHDIYINSKWDICLTERNYCNKTVDFLYREHIINKTLLKTSTTVSKPNTTSASLTTSGLIITTSNSSGLFTTKSSASSKTTSVGLVISLNETVTDTSFTASVIVPSSSPDTTPSSTMKLDVAAPSTGGEFPPPLSYIYPILGSLVILIEIVALCAFFCYQKKRGVRYKKHRRPSTGSGAVQEETIAAVNASPNKSTPYHNSIYNEDEVVKEDQHIFNSYMNLRFIDESEEATPERKLIKL